jgi:hypothetical protein
MNTKARNKMGLCVKDQRFAGFLFNKFKGFYFYPRNPMATAVVVSPESGAWRSGKATPGHV